MLHAQSKLLRVFGLALLLACVAQSAYAKPKAAKHPSASVSVSTDKAPSSPPAEAQTEPPDEPASAPAAATPQDKPRLQVTQAAAAGDTPARSGEAAAAAAPSPEVNEKLAALRSDVGTLTDDLVEARSRAALLGKTLFKTQIRVRVQNLAAPDPVLVKLVLKLDGAPIFRGDAAALSGDDARQVFQSFIAPGPHVLAAEIEQRSKDDAAYGYVLHDTYRFQALRDKRSELTLILDDDSDLASEFPDDAEGEYDVRMKLRVRTKALNEP